MSAALLQGTVHQRYKLLRSIVITSNRVVQDWGEYLGDTTMVTTILGRLMHRCAMLEFEGKSYRLKKAALVSPLLPHCQNPTVLPGAVWGSHRGPRRGTRWC